MLRYELGVSKGLFFHENSFVDLKKIVAKIFTVKKLILAFFERIWLLLSKIYFFGSEVKHPAQTLLYRPIHVFFACYTLNGRVIYVLHVFMKQKS